MDFGDRKYHQKKMKELVERANGLFRQYRLNFIRRILEIVLHENMDVEKQIEISNKDPRKCLNSACAITYGCLKRKCSVCFFKVGKVRNEESRLVPTNDWKITKSFDVGQKGTFNKKKISVGKPAMKNPNTYDSIKAIIEEYKDINSIGVEREWVALGCDGPPYCIGSRIIEKNPEKFDWLTLVSGMGHLHMNQMKTFFKVCDQVFMEPLGKEVLKFESKKAYDYFINAKDTHKSFQAITVLLFGATAELCYKFKQENQCNICTGEAFLGWIEEKNENKTFYLVSQLILNYAFAIYLQKQGVRCNDVKAIEAGRYKFLRMFYGFRHPIYQKVEYRDLRNRAFYLTDLKSTMDENLTFSKSNLNRNHQGGDFVLEEKIKSHKMIAPKGSISKDTWKRISRSTDDIESIYVSVSKK